MAQQPADLQAILAALAAQRPANTPSQPPATHQQPPPGMPLPGYPGLPPGMNAGALAGFSLPQPTSSGSLDLSSIKPVNTGSVSYGDNRSYNQDRDPRRGNPYRRSRSRSNSPPRRDSYNPYRDDRRDDSRRGGAGGFGRDRSRSPRGARFSPQNGRGYGRDRSPPRRDNNNANSDDSEVISIDSNLVGLVIGRQGENLRRIEQTTQARIQFITPADHPGPQRQCRISGSPQARDAAKREIYRTIDDNAAQHAQGRGGGGGSGGYNNRQDNKPPSYQQQQPQAPAPLQDGENAIQIMVPDRTVGLIIGRGGETIRDLQEKSGCHINIVGANKSINGLRPVNLIGSVQASTMAKDLIMEIVESDTRGPGQNNDKQQQNNHSGNNYQARNNDNQQNSGKISETIKVPSDAVGMIIGKGGETIKEMQSTTQCKINVSQPVGADIERDIGLVGTPQALDAAKRAIWEKVDMVREKGNQRGNPRNDNNDRYQQYGQQNSHGGQQSYAQNQPQAAPAGGADASADPYAPYGGYANYMALWYAAIQNGAKPPGQDGQSAPGA